MYKKPDPNKAIDIGKSTKLPDGVRSCTANVKPGTIPELDRKPIHVDGATYVPTSRTYMRKKRGPIGSKIVGGEI
jgi:hypothetical protein